MESHSRRFGERELTCLQRGFTRDSPAAWAARAVRAGERESVSSPDTNETPSKSGSPPELLAEAGCDQDRP